MLQRVQRKTATDLIIDQLTELIESGTLHAGDKVPTEHDLSTQLGVSRGTVREALRALQAMGLIERSNDGTVVSSDAPIRLLSRSLSSEQVELELDIAHLFQARRILEGEIAALAAERIRPDALEELRSLCRQMEAAGVDFETYFSLDMRFHNVICGVAGNPVLTRLWSVIHELLDIGRGDIRRAEGIQDQSNRNHTLLLQAFEAKDAAAAREVVHKSLLSIEQLLIEELKPRPDRKKEAHDAATVNS